MVIVGLTLHHTGFCGRRDPRYRVMAMPRTRVTLAHGILAGSVAAQNVRVCGLWRPGNYSSSLHTSRPIHSAYLVCLMLPHS